jgi:YfiH family protein
VVAPEWTVVGSGYHTDDGQRVCRPCREQPHDQRRGNGDVYLRQRHDAELTNKDSFEWRDTASGRALVCVALEPYASHLFTTREWRLGAAGDGDRAAAWRELARAMGVDAAHLARAHQVHGATVIARRAGDPPRPEDDPLPHADILISDDPALALAIQTADCVPLLIADRLTGVVAAAHAGWRGLAAGVPGVTVAALGREFGSAPPNLVAAVGPSISADRYEVGDDVRARFREGGFSEAAMSRWFLAGARPGHWQFDGWRAAQDQLEAAGLTIERIHVAAACTAGHPDLFCSYRRDGKGAGRIAGAIRRVSGVRK